MINRSAIIGAALFAVCSPTLAYSATCGATVQPLIFGNVNILDGLPHDTTSDITITCDASGAETVSFDIALSTGGSGTFERALTSGANRLEYNIYSDSSRSIIWGDGSASTATVSDVVIFAAPAQQSRNYTVYGRILGNQETAVIGTYGDAVIVTLTYQ